MQSWPAPEIPRLPGRGSPPQLRDTATGTRRATEPGAPVSMYVCGITPYDATHLGHAATYLAFDTLLRAWTDAGSEVAYCQNVTDVDEPLLQRAERDGEDWAALAEREIALFREDMTALRIVPPRWFVGAVEAIPEIVELIEVLQDRGAAYELEGDIYFSVAAAPHLGEVAGLDVATMLTVSAENGGDPDRPGKKDPLDVVLWRGQRPNEPSWDSPLGPGRPGWHIECAAIALCRMGPTLDVQGGGRDLAFPHHEMGAAHAEVATGERFARAYVHGGMVGLDGEKMSKSRGNLVFVSALRHEGVDPAALRLALLAHPYGADWEWTDADLPAATDRLARWRAAARRAAGPPAGPLLADVRRRVADDLDTPGALACVDEWCAASGTDRVAPELARDLVDALLGIRL